LPRKARQVGKWERARHFPTPTACGGRALPLAGEGYENEQASGTRVICKSYQTMRALTIMTTAAVALATTFVFAPRANAERICRQVCDQAGVCQSICVDDDHVFLDNSDKDFYLRHGQPDAFLGR